MSANYFLQTMGVDMLDVCLHLHGGSPDRGKTISGRTCQGLPRNPSQMILFFNFFLNCDPGHRFVLR